MNKELESIYASLVILIHSKMSHERANAIDTFEPGCLESYRYMLKHTEKQITLIKAIIKLKEKEQEILDKQDITSIQE